MARWIRSLMDSDAALDTPDEGPCHGFNGRPTHWREIRTLARAGPRCPPTIQLLFRPRGVISMRGPRPGRPHPWPGLDQERRMSRLHASLEVKAMKTRNAWLALVVLLAVHGSARSDFIATATLTGAADDVTTTGFGQGTVIYNAAAETLSVTLTFNDLTSPTAIPTGVPGAAHIHFGTPTPPGGPILFPFAEPYTIDFPIGFTSGTYT